MITEDRADDAAEAEIGSGAEEAPRAAARAPRAEQNHRTETAAEQKQVLGELAQPRGTRLSPMARVEIHHHRDT